MYTMPAFPARHGGRFVTLLEERMRTPTGHGRLAGANAVAAVGNPACGDVLTLHLRIKDGCIADAAFESLGSAYQLATASVLCDCIRGQSLDEARSRTSQSVLEQLPDLPQRHRYLARLSIDALHKALHTWEHGAPPPSRAGPVDDAGGRAFVRRILGTGRPWTTAEIDAMAEAEAIRLPTSTVRFLAALKKDGLVEGTLDAEAETMRWTLQSN